MSKIFSNLKATARLAATICALAGGLAGSMASADAPGIPPQVTNSQNPQDVPSPPRESLQQITVPPDFEVTLFAGEPDVAQPIAFDFDDRGRLWVVECYSHPNWRPRGTDRVLIFEDRNHDGQFDHRKVFWDEGNYLTGIAYGHGGIFLCNTPRLIFLPDKDYDDMPDGPPEVLLDGWVHTNPHNVFNNLNWGPDGWLYGCVGQNAESLVGPPGAPPEQRTRITRGIWRYHPSWRRFEVVAQGAVNPWGLDFDEHGEGFFSNCVLPHLWHLIPGGYYQRRPGERDNPHAYQRLQPICDHLHWGGGAWTSSRGGQGIHSVAGGGHAHTGAMIYLGDNWPAEYRHTFFTGNVHGNRINNDTLARRGASYTASHRPDFLLGNSPWFRSLAQKYGPDGGVFVSDWHDYGECHDNDGSHRTSGRIYKVVFTRRTLTTAAVDLAALSPVQLVELQEHKNAWFSRHARRLLHERFLAGDDCQPAIERLRATFANHPDTTRKLRALWALNLIGGADADWLAQQLGHPAEQVRAWVVRLLCDRSPPDATVVEQFANMARDEASPLVRLYLAAMLSRLPVESRTDVASALVGRGEDADDESIPLMLWYGIEPLVASDQAAGLRLLSACEIPLIRQNIARRLAEGN